MRVGSLLLVIASLAGCSGVMPASIVQPPPEIDPNSEAFQRQLAEQRAAALAKVARSRRNVTRTFTVGWEMHYGYFLGIPSDPNSVVMPDILDEAVRAKFDRENTQEALAAHLGHKLVCECEGVPWSDYGPRFLVRKANLHWQKAD